MRRTASPTVLCPSELRLAASERFWVDGLGLEVLFRAYFP